MLRSIAAHSVSRGLSGWKVLSSLSSTRLMRLGHSAMHSMPHLVQETLNSVCVCVCVLQPTGRLRLSTIQTRQEQQWLMRARRRRLRSISRRSRMPTRPSLTRPRGASTTPPTTLMIPCPAQPTPPSSSRSVSTSHPRYTYSYHDTAHSHALSYVLHLVRLVCVHNSSRTDIIGQHQVI